MLASHFDVRAEGDSRQHVRGSNDLQLYNSNGNNCALDGHNLSMLMF